MHYCNICNYFTEKSNYFNKHLKTNKHILKTTTNIINEPNGKNEPNEPNETIEINEVNEPNETIEINEVNEPNEPNETIEINETNELNENIESKINHSSIIILYCSFCNKEYSHSSSLYRHKKICKKKPVDIITISEMERIKNDYENKLKIRDKDLKIKELENKNLQLQLKNIIASNNTSNTNINIVNNNINNINISKLDYLNLNFSNVIDFDTFLDNFNNKYCLTEKQSHKILKNYLEDGIDSYISTVDYYIKDSAIRQYNDLGIIVTHENVVLPFLSPDKSLKEYFKKIGIWNKTTNKEPIEKIITIINNKILEDTKFSINFDDQQKNKTTNGFLKKASYTNATKDLIVKYN